ncbi:tail completion protein gp17 [Asticcacaulis sp.]|uniref:tail completion protein gp17 n=1 Tax=Asticcacaulis sp. TaxID=1872648 RepID=UPI003F7C570E
MIDPADALQAAVVAAVRALTNPGVTIYEEPPAKAVYPYVSLSGIVVTDDGDGDCYLGSVAEVTLHLCDRADTGTKGVKPIGKRLLAALDTELTVAGFEVVVHEALPALYAADPESPVRGTLRFRYDLAPIA